MLGTVAIWFVLTGGAFVIPWTSIAKWKSLIRTYYYIALAAASLPVVFVYFFDRALLEGLWSVRLIRKFYSCSPWLSVTVISLSFLSTQFAQQLSMHYGMETHLWDFAFFDQVLWNTAKGDFLITSVRGGLHVFAEHFKPFLVMMAGIYRLCDSTPLLLFVFDLCLAASFAFVYLIARRLTKDHAAALTCCVVVYFYQPLISGANFLIHTQMLIDPFLLAGFYLVLRNRLFSGLFFFLFALSCKESAIPDVAGLGLFFLATREYRKGIPVLLLAVFWLCLFIFVVEPRFVYAAHFKEKWVMYKGWLHPNMELIKTLLKPNPVEYIFKVFAPFLFICMLCPQWYFLLLPSLTFRLASLEWGMRSVQAHYMGGFEALIFIAFIYGLARILKKIPTQPSSTSIRRTMTSAITPPVVYFAVAITALIAAGRPQAVTIERFLREASRFENQRVIRTLENIPSRYSVLTNQPLSAHSAHRSRLYVFCSMFPKTPYQESAQKPDLIATDMRDSDPCSNATLNELLQKGYREIFTVDYLRLYAQDTGRPDIQDLVRTLERSHKTFVPHDWSSFPRFFFRIGLMLLIVAVLFRSAKQFLEGCRVH